MGIFKIKLDDGQVFVGRDHIDLIKEPKAAVFSCYYGKAVALNTEHHPLSDELHILASEYDYEGYMGFPK